MADDGVTLYYRSRCSFDLEKACNYLAKSGFFIKQPGTQLITGIGLEDDITETKQKKIKELIHNNNNLGINLWLEPEHCIFWSFSQIDNYFFQNFSFSSLLDLYLEKLSKVLIEYALQELREIGENFLGFSIDQYGQTDYDDNFDSFITKQKETLKYHDSPDLLFLPKDKLSQIILDDRFEIVQLNQNFTCVAKNPELLNFTKSLLSKK